MRPAQVKMMYSEYLRIIAIKIGSKHGITMFRAPRVAYTPEWRKGRNIFQGVIRWPPMQTKRQASEAATWLSWQLSFPLMLLGRAANAAVSLRPGWPTACLPFLRGCTPHHATALRLALKKKDRRISVVLTRLTCLLSSSCDAKRVLSVLKVAFSIPL